MDIITLCISAVGMIFSVVLVLIHNKTFVQRYKNYKSSVSRRIIRENKPQLLKLIKENDSSNLEKKLNEILEKFTEQNKPLNKFDAINNLTRVSLILFLVSIITTLFYSRITTAVIGTYSYSDLSYLSLVLGVIFLGITLYQVFDLSKKIAEHELRSA